MTVVGDDRARRSPSIVRRPLLNFLGSRNVLPKYGFPVDVVELNLARSGDAAAANLELSRDLELAISDYAPGAMTVAGKGLWRSTGLVRRSDREWPHTSGCDTFHRGLVEASTACASCGSEARAAQGRFVIPLYGFVGEAHDKPGETRPQRLAMRETFFGDYRDTPPEPAIVPGLEASARFSHQGGPARGPNRWFADLMTPPHASTAATTKAWTGSWLMSSVASTMLSR